MVDSKVISTATVVTRISGTITIRTFYNGEVTELPNIIAVIIAEDNGTRNSVSYINGDLLVDMTNYPDNIDATINSNGEFIVSTLSGDEDQYSVDDDGNLIYTIP